MSAQNVIKFQSIRLQEYYLTAVSERAQSAEKVVANHNHDEFAHRRRLRKMQGKNFLVRAAMVVGELFTGKRLAA